MQDIISQARIQEVVRQATADTLRVKVEQVRPECSFVNDLGLESLDFLDINYRLEQAFGLKMARHFFLEHVEDMFGEGKAIDERGRLTDAAIRLIRIRYGEQSLPQLGDGLEMEQVPALITVQSIVDVVADILGTLPEKCACGASAWKSEDGTHIVCGACGARAPFTNGDELTRAWLTRVQAEHGIF